MSDENVKIVRAAYEHFNRTGEADYGVLDPDVVYDVSRRTFDPGVFYGHDGVRNFTALVLEQWETLRVEPKDVVEGGDTVVVSVHLVGIGRESGAETTAKAAHVWELRGGKIVRHTTFQTMAEALEAAGLSE
jgi:ketosteroid isomerase-like protein